MAQTITIRPAAAADLSAIDTLLGRSYPTLLKADYPPSVMVTAVPLLSRAQPRLIASGTYYLAETADGVLLGVGGWTRSRTTPSTGDIRHVATDPLAVRQGVGRRLLRRIMDISAASGIKRLDCLSTRTAVPFYASLGFVPGQTRTIALAQGITFQAIHMRLAL